MAPKAQCAGTPHDAYRAATASNLIEILLAASPPGVLRAPPRWADIMSGAARPGTGGRRKRVDFGFEIEATRELRERYGQPDEHSSGRTLLLVWSMDPDGEGIVAARLSSTDVQKGETALGQIHNGLALAAGHALKPAIAVVALRTSGGLAYDQRPDLDFIRDSVATRGLSWICYREPDRVARDQHAAYSFYKFLEDTGTDLYLCSLGRRVDWSSQGDKLMIGTQTVIGEYERGSIKARTHNALKARFLEEGRGYPGFKSIGFKRDAKMYLVQDLEQWPYVLEMNEMYGTLRSDGGTSLRDLAAYLTNQLGFTISSDRVRTMLKDPMYVTGIAHVNYNGVAYPIRPIELVNPVPIETFERNQQLMAAVKGRQRVNPLGHFLLNRIDFRHDACRHEVRPGGQPVMLRGEGKSYKHSKGCPLPECRQFTLPHRQVDAAIVAELLRLCEDPELQRRYQQRARTDADKPSPGILTAGQERSYKARVTDLARQREEIVAGWLRDGSKTHDLNPRYLQEAVEHVDAEIARLERQLEISKRLQAAEKRAPSDDHDKLLQRARQLLTPEAPSDPELAQRRLLFTSRLSARSSPAAPTPDSSSNSTGPSCPPTPSRCTSIPSNTPVPLSPARELTCKARLGSQFRGGAGRAVRCGGLARSASAGRTSAAPHRR
jgi:DNA invertase Pin-like site-specific DNA recombinase